MFYKKVVLQTFATFTGKHLCWSRFFNLLNKDSDTGVFQLRNFTKTYFKNIFVRLLHNFRKLLFEALFLDNRFQNNPDSEILQKYQSLSNQSFKHKSASMSSLYLTPTLPFEPSFRMFVINGYYTKSKRLQFLFF